MSLKITTLLTTLSTTFIRNSWKDRKLLNTKLTIRSNISLPQASSLQQYSEILNSFRLSSFVRIIILWMQCTTAKYMTRRNWHIRDKNVYFASWMLSFFMTNFPSPCDSLNAWKFEEMHWTTLEKLFYSPYMWLLHYIFETLKDGFVGKFNTAFEIFLYTWLKKKTFILAQWNIRNYLTAEKMC